MLVVIQVLQSLFQRLQQFVILECVVNAAVIQIQHLQLLRHLVVGLQWQIQLRLLLLRTVLLRGLVHVEVGLQDLIEHMSAVVVVVLSQTELRRVECGLLRVVLGQLAHPVLLRNQPVLELVLVLIEHQTLPHLLPAVVVVQPLLQVVHFRDESGGPCADHLEHQLDVLAFDAAHFRE